MALFSRGDKADPKDELIEAQRSEIAYLRSMVSDLQAQLLAISDARAYRMLHRPPDPDPSEKPSPTPYEQRNLEWTPDEKQTLEQLRQRVMGRLS